MTHFSFPLFVFVFGLTVCANSSRTVVKHLFADIRLVVFFFSRACYSRRYPLGGVHTLSSVNRRSHQRHRIPDIRIQEFHTAPCPISNENTSGVSLSTDGILTYHCLSCDSGRRPVLGLSGTNSDVNGAGFPDLLFTPECLKTSKFLYRPVPIASFSFFGHLHDFFRLAFYLKPSCRYSCTMFCPSRRSPNTILNPSLCAS